MLESAVIVLVVAGAAVYVVRSWLPGRKKAGCDSCPQNRNRGDDYV